MKADKMKARDVNTLKIFLTILKDFHQHITNIVLVLDVFVVLFGSLTLTRKSKQQS